MVANNITQYST